MKLIPLTQGQFAKVDDKDFVLLGHLKWCAAWSKITKSFYAVRGGPYVRVGGKRRRKAGVRLHRVILGLTDPKIFGDHINHDTLDCQRHNLRPSTPAQNCVNKKGLSANNTSGFRGVTWLLSRKMWYAQIVVAGKHINLGYYSDKISAAHAYAKAATKYFGEFAEGIFDT